jgi:oligopeptidase B
MQLKDAGHRATAKDPAVVVYRKGFERNGKSPLFLYAYGPYGSNVGEFLHYPAQPARSGHSVIAQPFARDEMASWPTKAADEKKIRSMTFVDSAEYLISEIGRKINCIEGGSAGGPLMVVVNLRPIIPRRSCRCCSWT